MTYTLEQLHKEAEAKRLTHLCRLRARYALARELGFSAQEAQLLSSRNEATIRRLAEERDLLAEA